MVYGQTSGSDPQGSDPLRPGWRCALEVFEAASNQIERVAIAGGTLAAHRAGLATASWPTIQSTSIAIGMTYQASDVNFERDRAGGTRVERGTDGCNDTPLHRYVANQVAAGYGRHPDPVVGYADRGVGSAHDGRCR